MCRWVASCLDGQRDVLAVGQKKKNGKAEKVFRLVWAPSDLRFLSGTVFGIGRIGISVASEVAGNTPGKPLAVLEGRAWIALRNGEAMGIAEAFRGRAAAIKSSFQENRVCSVVGLGSVLRSNATFRILTASRSRTSRSSGTQGLLYFR